MLQTTQEPVETSWLKGALARFAADNAELAAPTRALLERLVPEPARHARLINTLSMLEHMGSHKIMSTQHGAAIDQSTLRHVAEEAHHAYFMKRQAEKAAARPLEYVPEDLLAPASARMYFQRLEARMVRRLAGAERTRGAYLFMSMIVEFRALWFYGLYSQVLRRAGHALSLKRLLGEEQNHLAEMAERLEGSAEHDELADEFLRYEKSLYARLLGAMTAAT